jgi:DNA polymerase
MRILHIDFETSSKANIKDTGTYRYCSDPTTDVICVGWAFDYDPVQVHSYPPNEVLEHIESGGLVYAHNASMEEQILYHIYGIENVNMRCTSAVASYHALPASLEAVAEHHGLSVKKDKEGYKVLRKHFKTPTDDIPNEDYDVIVEYCRQDVEVERAIHQRLGELPANELKVWQLDQKMNRKGWKVDTALARSCIKAVEEAKATIETDLQRLTDGAVEKPTQAKRIITWLESRGIETSNLTKDTVVDLLEQDIPAEVREVLLCRQRGGGSATGKYVKALAMADPNDNKVRGNLKYHGATTGRWAGSGLQVQNLPRGNVSDTDTLADMFLRGNIGKVKEVAGNVYDGAKSAVRPLLTASSPDKRLIVADYSAIECRVLAWLAGQEDLVDEIRSGVDTYCSFASKVFKKTITKEDKKERAVGKVAILGLGYGMGANKFQDTLKSMAGLQVNLNFAQSVVDTYRSTYAHIRNYWYDLERNAIEAVKYGESKDGKWYREGKTLHHILSSGRIIRYQNVSLMAGKFDNEAIKYRRPLGKNMVWSDTYGGKLTENICQATARCVMSDSMLRLDEAGIDLIATVHDEVIAEAPANEADLTLERMESIMSEEKAWSGGLPLATEGFVSYRFKK